MNKTTALVLIVIAIVFGLLAYKEHDKNTADIKIGKLELSAEKKGGSNEMLYWGIAGAAVVAGIAVTVIRKK